MSEADFNHLSPNRIPILDASGQWINSPLELTSSSFLILADDGFDYGVTYGSQIAAFSLYGATPEEINHGILYIDIQNDPATLNVRTGPYESGVGELIASATVAGEGVPSPLVGASGHPNIHGSVTLSTVEPDWNIQLLLPTSSVVPLLSEFMSYNISEMRLYGVNASNSENGVLNWTVTLDESTAYFTLDNPLGGTVASTSVALTSYPPVTCELVSENNSGITGHIVLEGFAESDGQLVVQILDSGIRIPYLAGTGTRALGVDANGRLTIMP